MRCSEEGCSRCEMCAGWILRLVVLAGAVLAAAGIAHAGGPRFVTGTQYWGAQSGQTMAWYTSTPVYATDPGDLSATVTHAQADAMVAAAAATWNVPVASLVLKQSGELAEHVSSQNTYFDATTNTVVFPADVSASNWQNIQIAVIYDTDGSVIDTLLGEDASDPSGCRQTGVVESVDSFGGTGTIQHAMLILNGRCVGSNPDDLLQMQYQVERAFGRVLGLAWAQVNDNIFTGASTPNATQLAYWPVMHPVDVLCSNYTYQCMTNPFTLRVDDLNSLAYLYPVSQSNLTAGKTLSSQNALQLLEYLEFPTGQGMDWVNVTVTPQEWSQVHPLPAQVASGVSGALYEQNTGNPVSGPESSEENVGTFWEPAEAIVRFARVPYDGVETLFMDTEAIDPLYTDEYALGPYERPPVTPSGSPVRIWAEGTEMVPDAASSCSPGADGTQSAPASSDPSGWWNGLLCGVGHSSWWSVAARAGRSWTVEVTALDETGAATMYKAQPVIGVWNVGDTGLPTVASAPYAMNSWAPGVTQVQVPASASDGSYMFAVADQFGGGRPDFAYQARFLYADNVSPSVVNVKGGQITITGEGFRQGNQVTVNGVAATVTSVTPNQIVALTPSMAAAGTSLGTNVDLIVTDAVTGGTATISGAVSYTNQSADVLNAVPPVPATLETGVPAPFAVRLYGPDGQTPLAGVPIEFSVLGSAVYSAAGFCNGSPTCAVTTDATGLAEVTVTATAAGQLTLTAAPSVDATDVVVTVTVTNPVPGIALMPAATGYVAAGGSGEWTLTLTTTLDSSPAAGVPVTWTGGSGLSFAPGATMTTDASGTASVTVEASNMPAGEETVMACGWQGAPCTAQWTVVAVPAAQWTVTVNGGAGQSVAMGTAFAPVSLLVTDGAGHPVQGAPVYIYQTVTGWEGACPANGACPAAPVLKATQNPPAPVYSDANGLVNVTPLSVAGIPQVVNIAAVTGTQGFVAFSLTQTP